MSRLLKILIYAVVLFFLFLWLSTIVKSCGSDKGTTTPSTTTASTEDSAEETYDQDDFFEEEGDESISDESEEPADDQIDYTEIDKVVEDKLNEKEPEPTPVVSRPSQTTPKPNNNRKKTVSKGTSSGKYMVIAGSFLIQNNAENMRKRLNNLGYDNASLVVFDLSQYHSVVAARFGTYEAALKVSNELKRRGMDCYVHAQQF